MILSGDLRSISGDRNHIGLSGDGLRDSQTRQIDDMVRVTLELIVEEKALQQALDEHDPEVPVSSFEERVWLEEALDQVLQSGKFSIQQIIIADWTP